MARAWAENKAARSDKPWLDRAWFVLTPQGLAKPDEFIQPVEDTQPETLAWADQITLQLAFYGMPLDCWLLAGIGYRVPLNTTLRECGVRVHEPLATLTIGRQLRWLKKTMEIDLKQLEAEIEAMTDAEVAEAIANIHAVRQAAGSTRGKERAQEKAKEERALLKAMQEMIEKGEITI